MLGLAGGNTKKRGNHYIIIFTLQVFLSSLHVLLQLWVYILVYGNIYMMFIILFTDSEEVCSEQ